MRLAVSFPLGRCLSDPHPPPRYGLAPFKYSCSPDVLWLYTSTRGQSNPTLAIPPPASQDLGKGWLGLRDHSQTLLTHLEHPWELLCQPPAQHRYTGSSGCFLVTQDAHLGEDMSCRSPWGACESISADIQDFPPLLGCLLACRSP